MGGLWVDLTNTKIPAIQKHLSISAAFGPLIGLKNQKKIRMNLF